MITIKHLNQAIYYGTLQPHVAKGIKVKVGFLTLTTKEYLGSSKWRLENSKGDLFEFTPYNGLVKLN